jgi:hypothetical protein
MRRRLTAYRLTQIVFLLVSAAITVANLSSGNELKAMFGPATFAFLLIPLAAEKLLRLKLGDPLRVMTLGFCFLGYSVGTALRWYDDVPFYDDFTHLLSGVFFTLIGICLYARVKKKPVYPADEWLLQVTYGFFFSMFVAVIWEIGEFLMYLVTKHDAQHHETTGVFDTMQDLIACFAGSVVMGLDYLYHAKKGARSPLMRAYGRFIAANNPPREAAEEPAET